MSERTSERVGAVAAIDRRRTKITAEIAALGLPLPGSLVERRTRCGNTRCRCHAGRRGLHRGCVRLSGTRRTKFLGTRVIAS